MENKGNFFAGVILGTAIGTLLGVLFAPAPGQETRQKVAEKGKEVGELALEKAKEKSELAVETEREVLSQLKEKLPESAEIDEAFKSIEKEF